MPGIVAIVRSRGPVSRESGQPPSSLVRLFLLQQTRPGAGRQSQNLDESFGVFLIVAVAHGEGRQIVRVERVRRMPLGYADVALIQRQADGTRDQLLGVVDKGVEGFAQRRKPQAEVNQLSVFETNLLFVVRHFAVQCQRLEFAMRGGDQGAARGLVEPAALHANEAIFYQVDAADRVAGADLVQQLNDLYRLQRHSV